jgi:hypothetical protein
MTELEFLKHFEKYVKVTLKNNSIIEGFCSSFCRSNDDSAGRANITINTENGAVIVNYEEVKEIKTITP